jgi:gamma-glutamyl phosphate reductase
VSDTDVSDEFEDDVEEMASALADARQRVAEAPASTVVANHAMGLYELAAIHLSAQPARLSEAALGIDALACLVEGLGDRMGENSGVLRDALHQIRLAFVQIKGQAAPAAEPAADPAESAAPPTE